MIYIRTCAYNAEKTLRQAMDSVLNQTYGDFKYYILDNGSMDRTGEIIREYAARDARIVPYYSEVNHNFKENLDFWNLSRQIPEGSFFCILDADDAYEPTFFQEMLDFMAENRLEIAACGTVFVDGDSGQAMGSRVLPQSILADTPERMDAYFPIIHWNLRQVWGKLYSSRAAAARHETERPDWWPRAYGGDTINVMECVKAVGSFGVYGKALHQYTVSHKSVSHQWIPERETADVTLHEKALAFLRQQCGKVSIPNLRFLYAVYFNAVKDTLAVWAGAELPFSEKLEILHRLLTQGVMRETLAADLGEYGIGEGEKRAVLQAVFQDLERHGYAEEDVPHLSAVYAVWNPDFETLVPPERLGWYTGHVPGLIPALALGDYPESFRILMKAMETGCREDFAAELARTLAALLEDQGAYILCSKLWIEALLQKKDLERAERELAEWESILPGDVDLAKLRRIARKSGRG